jgi:fructose-1,6-bisphosphatase
MAGSFIKQIERARAAAQTTRPTEKNISEMTQEELDVALVDSKRRVVEANRAVAAVAAEYTRPPTLAAKLAELQRGKRKHWR